MCLLLFVVCLWFVVLFFLVFGVCCSLFDVCCSIFVVGCFVFDV